MRLRLTINGRARDVDVEPSRTLLDVLRDTLGIFDVKEGCGEGVCGACTVLLDGRPVSSCLVLAPTAARRAITTVRALEDDGELHPLQQAFLRHGAVQCGFCTPGMLLTALAFLQGHPDADREALRHAIEGNLCRCTGYAKILDALTSEGGFAPLPTLRGPAGPLRCLPPDPDCAGKARARMEVLHTASGENLIGERGLRLVGQPVIRHDARDKVAAATAYAGDWAMPGMLHGVVVRSPYPSARIRSLDTTKAAAMPGVATVMTARDVPRNALWTDVPGQTTEVGPLRARLHVLAEDRVRHQGEPIALVAAETLEQARAAAEAVEVDYEPLPGVFDPVAALEPGAPAVHDAGNLLAHWHVERGDLAAGFARADVIVEGEYHTQFVDAAYLEPESGVAWVDGDGVITIRLSTQVIEHFRDVAEVLDVPQNRVRVIGTYLGGGFGGKEDVTVEVYLGLLTWETRRPVKMVWTRQESLLARAKRHPYRLRYRTGALRTGEIVAQEIELLGDSGGYAYLSALVLLYSTVTAAGPYRVPAASVDARVAYTNNPPTSAMRGFGAMQVVFGYESQMDRVARALGLSPIEIRRMNALRRGDALPVGQVMETHVALPELIDRAWEGLGAPTPPRAPHVKVGRGIACNLQPYGRIVWLHDWSSAWVGFEMDGSLVVRCGVPDVGGGQASSLCQIAAEVLGVPLERVSVHIADSALTALAGTTTASRQLYMSGNAVLKASRELREQLLTAAARLLDADAAALDLADSAVQAPGERALPLADLLRACARMGVPRSHLGVYHAPAGEPVDLQKGSGKIFPDYTFGCHAAEVEVDTQTGIVKVLKLVAAHDVGRAINPQSVEGQIQGGAVQGLGYALMEEVILQDGINMTTSFASYLIPSASDLPDVAAVVVESGEGLGPFGARGIGEPPIAPPAAAVANAIEDATGARVTQLPLTPERIARALGLLAEAG